MSVACWGFDVKAGTGVCVCRGEWPPSHVSDKSNGKRRIWVETVSFGVSHLASNRCLARKHTPPQPCPGETNWEAILVSATPVAVWADGGSSEREEEGNPSRPRWPQRYLSYAARDQARAQGHHGWRAVPLVPRPQSPPLAGKHLGMSIPPPSARVSPPAPAAGAAAGVCAVLRGSRPWPEFRGPRRAAAMSLRSVPKRGLARQPRAPGRSHLTNAVFRFISPFAGGCSWVCYRYIQPGAAS